MVWGPEAGLHKCAPGEQDRPPAPSIQPLATRALANSTWTSSPPWPSRSSSPVCAGEQ
ncbi:hypothetical protein FIBSPDRAFT_868453 [Athelia psychrophila]|uniref:Uncharacterized protein n=1 Tax=Athelia psychrophila TaxID=1759441 RepID=A0A166ASM0_9AGAM|nr:hypothetical protein FIBSPDRAFT_879483 [Fibularhizoctonia sp. CBS 109695]KZP11916.1 hypothetical protein FIBSPDRAFT_870808 [Fibularhizoctonia sp. CBS 109695]KZP14220.1 hypothetical protein FIBSPDRAFT_868453 [Fibularhizoctonia sp. CBS 109695]